MWLRSRARSPIFRRRLRAPATEPAPAPVARRQPPRSAAASAAQGSASRGAASHGRRESRNRLDRGVRVRSYEGRIESSPQVEEQEYKQITRDHETALDFYNSLLKKMNESSMATALEQRQQGEQFHVMDAPNLPEDRYFPNRKDLRGRRACGGLVLGLLLAGWLEYRDTSVRNERTFGPLPSCRRWP
jgi:hypothetical protein